jgi:hypothetical protein
VPDSLKKQAAEFAPATTPPPYSWPTRLLDSGEQIFFVALEQLAVGNTQNCLPWPPHCDCRWDATEP